MTLKFGTYLTSLTQVCGLYWLRNMVWVVNSMRLCSTEHVSQMGKELEQNLKNYYLKCDHEEGKITLRWILGHRFCGWEEDGTGSEQ